MADHKLITDPEVHEPKGITTAPAKSVYVSNGVGSGTWQTLSNYFNTEGVDGAVLTAGSVTSEKLATMAVTSNKIADQAVGYPQMGLGAVHGENLGSYNAASADGKVIWKTVIRQLMEDSFQAGDICPLFGSVTLHITSLGSSAVDFPVSVGETINLAAYAGAAGTANAVEARKLQYLTLPLDTMVMSQYHTGYYSSPQGTIESIDHALPLSAVNLAMPVVEGHQQSGAAANELVYSKTFRSMLAHYDIPSAPLSVVVAPGVQPCTGTYIIDDVHMDTITSSVRKGYYSLRRIA